MRHLPRLLVTSLLLVGALFPVTVTAQQAPATAQEQIFEARVTAIIDEQVRTREDGAEVRQQDLKLQALTGPLTGHEVVYHGISPIEVLSGSTYRVGDRVMVTHAVGADGQDVFYVNDFVRRRQLYLLAGLFALATIAVGRLKGVKALVSLAATFVIIVWFIVPQILNGANPLLIGVVGSAGILALVIYLTEGWNRRSHVAMVSILVTLLITAVLAMSFTALTRLTGMTQEEASYLVSTQIGARIDFAGLLIAAMLIGTLGVLDDVIVSQIEAVTQLRVANKHLSRSRLFALAFKVGKTHLGAVVNTLFLAYTGASLPLLLIFSLNQGSSVTWSQAINSEIVATEIVRVMVGGIGLALAVPIATFFAVYGFGRQHRELAIAGPTPIATSTQS